MIAAMTDRRALFLSLADRVEKLDGKSSRRVNLAIYQAAHPDLYARGLSMRLGLQPKTLDRAEAEARAQEHMSIPDYTGSYDAIASLPGPEIVAVLKTKDGKWMAGCLDYDGAIAPTRKQAELAARLRGMAEIVTPAEDTDLS